MGLVAAAAAAAAIVSRIFFQSQIDRQHGTFLQTKDDLKWFICHGGHGGYSSLVNAPFLYLCPIFLQLAGSVQCGIGDHSI